MKYIYDDINLQYNNLENLKLPTTKPENPVAGAVYMDNKTLYVYTENKTWEILLSDCAIIASEDNTGAIKLLKKPVDKIYYYTYDTDKYITLSELSTGSITKNDKTILIFKNKPIVVSCSDNALLDLEFVYDVDNKVWIQNFDNTLALDTTKYTLFTSGYPVKNKVYVYGNSSDSTIKYYSLVEGTESGLKWGYKFPPVDETTLEYTVETEGIVDPNATFMNIASTDGTYILQYNGKILDKFIEEKTLVDDTLPENCYNIQLTNNNSAYVDLNTIHNILDTHTNNISEINKTLDTHKENIDKNANDISDLSDKIDNIEIPIATQYDTGVVKGYDDTVYQYIDQYFKIQNVNTKKEYIVAFKDLSVYYDKDGSYNNGYYFFYPCPVILCSDPSLGNDTTGFKNMLQYTKKTKKSGSAYYVLKENTYEILEDVSDNYGTVPFKYENSRLEGISFNYATYTDAPFFWSTQYPSENPGKFECISTEHTKEAEGIIDETVDVTFAEDTETGKWYYTVSKNGVYANYVMADILLRDTLTGYDFTTVQTTAPVYAQSNNGNTEGILYIKLSDIPSGGSKVTSYTLTLDSDYASGSTVNLGDTLDYDSTSLQQVTINGLPAIANTDYTVGTSTYTTNIDLVEGDVISFTIIK